MPTRDPTHPPGALHGLRQRWFAPSRPLPVDDDAHRLPLKDAGDAEGLEGDAERPVTTIGKLAP